MKVLAKLKSLFWGDEKLNHCSFIFIVLAILSTAFLLISNIIANKLMPVFGWKINGQAVTLTCGVLCFPITYIISDIFSEVYGYSASRKMTWLGFLANIFMIIIFCLADLIKPATAVFGQAEYAEAFHTILGIDFSPNEMSPIGSWGPFGCLLASLLAFLIGSWIDDLVFEKIRNKMKDKTGNKWFILRAITSSFCGELIDSLIFIPLMYFFNGVIGYYTFGTVIAMIFIQVGIKILYEIIISPVTGIIVTKIKKRELELQGE